MILNLFINNCWKDIEFNLKRLEITLMILNVFKIYSLNDKDKRWNETVDTGIRIELNPVKLWLIWVIGRNIKYLLSSTIITYKKLITINV